MCKACGNPECTSEYGVTLKVAETTSQKATLLGAAGVLSKMTQESAEQGKNDMAQATHYASAILEQMALGNLPIITFADNEGAVKYFEEAMANDEDQKEFDALAAGHVDALHEQLDNLNG